MNHYIQVASKQVSKLFSFRNTVRLWASFLLNGKFGGSQNQLGILSMCGNVFLLVTVVGVVAPSPFVVFSTRTIRVHMSRKIPITYSHYYITYITYKTQLSP